MLKQDHGREPLEIHCRKTSTLLLATARRTAYCHRPGDRLWRLDVARRPRTTRDRSASALRPSRFKEQPPYILGETELLALAAVEIVLRISQGNFGLAEV